MDIYYNLHEHGWSEITFKDKENSFSETISHVFSNPINDLIILCEKLKLRQSPIELLWFGEPGCLKLIFSFDSDRRNKYSLLIQCGNGSYPDQGKLEDEVEFHEIDADLALFQIYAELIKIKLSFRNKEYALVRKGEFNFSDFVRLEKLISQDV